MSLLLDIIFPRQCFGCGSTGQYLCPNCRSELILKSVKSGDRLSLFRYHGAIKNLITCLKFNFAFDIVPEISDFMAKSIKSKYPHLLAYWQQNNFILVPIPLHTHRFNWRGFNQSELICRELSLKLKLSFDSNILVRSINTIPQTTLKNKSLRRSNIESVFTLKKSFAPLTQGGIKRGFENDKWLNDKYILVDDVYTTGSTINSAKSVFSKNTELWTLTIAG